MILREGEKLVAVIRRHKSSLSGSFSLSALLISVLLFILLYFKFNFFGYGWQVFYVTLLVVVLLDVYKFNVWRNNVLLITNQRIVKNDQRGLFNRAVTEILYSDIHEIIFKKKGFASVINNYGTLIIRTPSDTKIIFNKIPDPEKVVEIINKTRTLYEPPAL